MSEDYERIFARRGSRYDAAMQRYPKARVEEFKMITRPLRLQPGDRLADIPSGGGYLAAYLPVGVELLAVEPVATFGGPDSPENQNQRPGRLCCPIDQVALANSSLQAIVSPAGLHHQLDKPAFYREAFRLLAPGGQLIIADGLRDSPVARFLNGFVDRHNPEGHQGWFLGPECPVEVAAAGFLIESATQERYHWHFPDPPAAADFCRELFGLDCPDQPLIQALEHELGLAPVDQGWRLDWSLFRICARRPTCPD